MICRLLPLRATALVDIFGSFEFFVSILDKQLADRQLMFGTILQLHALPLGGVSLVTPKLICVAREQH